MDLEKIDSEKNEMQNVKQRFFAMRNGVVADALRKNGSPFRIIFGLNLPQLRQIASVFGYNKELAKRLWENSNTRESRLLAPMLVNPSEISTSEIFDWLDSLTGSLEEIDILCHSLLRNLPDTQKLTSSLYDSENPLKRYTALRLAFGLLPDAKEYVRNLALKEVNAGEPLTTGIARQLLDEIDFLNESE